MTDWCVIYNRTNWTTKKRSGDVKKWVIVMNDCVCFQVSFSNVSRSFRKFRDARPENAAQNTLIDCRFVSIRPLQKMLVQVTYNVSSSILHKCSEFILIIFTRELFLINSDSTTIDWTQSIYYIRYGITGNTYSSANNWRCTYLKLTRNSFDATTTVSNDEEDSGVLSFLPRKQTKWNGILRGSDIPRNK